MSAKRILVVEDEGITGMLLQEVLEKLGYEVIGLANSGEEAVHLAGEELPDLIIMDIHLQGEVDGIDATKIIHSKAKVPIVYLTAHADEKTLDRAKQTEPYGYIVKPFRDLDLQTGLELAFYRKNMEGELESAQQRAQYNAFQAGVAEMSTSILHNIGNAIMSISHRAEQMEEAGVALEDMAKLLGKMQIMIQKKRDQGQSQDEIMAQLLGIFEEMSGDLKTMSQERFLPNARQIRTGVEHIADIIKIHQDSAQPQTMTTHFDLHKLIEDAVSIQADALNKYDVAVKFSFINGIDDVNLPRSQLLQLFINLIKNSIESIGERKRENPVDGVVKISIKKLSEEQIELAVSDNGCGIPPEKLTEIFRYGFSTKKRGTGFGLHSAAIFIQSLGGSIEAHSAGRNQGTEMVVILPLKRRER
ncbi:MAG: response regulator [Magnetococcales bacterium]|nr:response regulator [Magnetococcales bacterium]